MIASNKLSSLPNMASSLSEGVSRTTIFNRPITAIKIANASVPCSVINSNIVYMISSVIPPIGTMSTNLFKVFLDDVTSKIPSLFISAKELPKAMQPLSWLT